MHVCLFLVGDTIIPLGTITGFFCGGSFVRGSDNTFKVITVAHCIQYVFYGLSVLLKQESLSSYS